MFHHLVICAKYRRNFAANVACRLYLANLCKAIFFIRNSMCISSLLHNMLAPQSSFPHSKISLSEFLRPQNLIWFNNQYSEQHIKSLLKLMMLWLGNQYNSKFSRTVVRQIIQWLVRFWVTLEIRVTFTAGNATLVDVIWIRRQSRFTTVYLWYDTLVIFFMGHWYLLVRYVMLQGRDSCQSQSTSWAVLSWHCSSHQGTANLIRHEWHLRSILDWAIHRSC